MIEHKRPLRIERMENGFMVYDVDMKKILSKRDIMVFEDEVPNVIPWSLITFLENHFYRKE